MKAFVLLFFFTCRLLALDITPKEVPVFKEVAMAKNIDSIDKAIQNHKLFKTVKRFRRMLHLAESNDGTWLKIVLQNSSNKPLQRTFVTKWRRINLELFWVKSSKVFKDEILKKQTYLKHSSNITIKPYEKVTLYIHAKKIKPLDQFSYMYFVDTDNLEEFIVKKNRLYNYGFFLGIIFAITIYSFLMYFSIKDKGYLYLGFYLFSVFYYTSDLWQNTFVLLENYQKISYYLIKFPYGIVMVILTILFTKKFLNTKKEFPFWDKFLNIAMVLIIPLTLIETRINIAMFMPFVYVIVGFYLYMKTKNKSALIFAIGFMSFPLYILMINLSRIFEWNFYFEYVYAKQIATCIEAFALNIALHVKIKDILIENEKIKTQIIKNKQMLLEQSRFASMGEMLASIAHQWRQPLNHLNMIFNSLQMASKANKLDNEYIKEVSNEGEKQLEYMSKTIEDFSSYFAIKGKKEEFKFEEVCKYAFDLVQSRIKKYNLSYTLKSRNDTIHISYKNELIQVLCVILNNAIDALVQSDTKDKQIDMFVTKNSIMITNNAGEIQKDILPHIFDPYFSTKDKKFGRGLGLYMAKTIVQKQIKGQLIVDSANKTTSFTVVV